MGNYDGISWKTLGLEISEVCSTYHELRSFHLLLANTCKEAFLLHIKVTVTRG